MIDSKQDYLELCTEAELIELPDKVRMGFMKELALKRIPTALGRLRGYRLVLAKLNEESSACWAVMESQAAGYRHALRITLERDFNSYYLVVTSSRRTNVMEDCPRPVLEHLGGSKSPFEAQWVAAAWRRIDKQESELAERQVREAHAVAMHSQTALPARSRQRGPRL